MDASPPDYDERPVLTRYVLRWYPHLMTPAERTGMRAIEMDWKLRTTTAGPSYRARLRQFTEGPVEREAIEMGAAEFRRRACDRILADHPGEIAINRCPRCDRIVRTPLAQQCPWCGNDWHPRPHEPPDAESGDPPA